MSGLCFGLITFSYGRVTDVWITFSEATVVVLQFSARVMDGLRSRLEHGVLLYKTCSTRRSDSTIIIWRAHTKRSAEGEGERRQREYFL